jgi:general secretion pathway protein K
MAVKSRQRGAALIIVLMLFAVLVALSVEVMYRLDHFRTRTSNLLEWDQRYQYALAAETVAVQALIDDLENDRNKGSLVDDCVSDSWGITLPPTPYEGAVFTASVQDLQGRFNLNWLVTLQGADYVRNPEAVGYLEQLLAASLPDPSRASPLAMEMADWIDSDNLVNGIDGAEDGEYRDRRTANIPIAHESELRGLRSFRPEDGGADPFWAYYTALPQTTLLNINTAPAVVLDAVLSNTVGNAGTQLIVSQREAGAINDVTSIMGMAPFSTLTPNQRTALQSMLTVRSEFFQVVVDVRSGDGISRLVTRIHRPDNGETVVFSRQIMPLLSPLEPPCNTL